MEGRLGVKIFDNQVPGGTVGKPSGRQELVSQADVRTEAVVVDEFFVVGADLGAGWVVLRPVRVGSKCGLCSRVWLEGCMSSEVVEFWE